MCSLIYFNSLLIPGLDKLFPCLENSSIGFCTLDSVIDIIPMHFCHSSIHKLLVINYDLEFRHQPIPSKCVSIQKVKSINLLLYPKIKLSVFHLNPIIWLLFGHTPLTPLIIGVFFNSLINHWLNDCVRLLKQSFPFNYRLIDQVWNLNHWFSNQFYPYPILRCQS